MSDPTAPIADTPTSTPTSDTPEIPWQKRYEDLRPEFDRTTQELAAERAAWDDEQTLLARLAEKHPHLLVDDEPEEEPTYQEPAAEPTPDPRIDAHDQWIALQNYERDLTRFVGDRELSDDGREFIEALNLKTGNNAKALEAAVDRWYAVTAPPEPEKPKPHATHVVANGSAVTDDVDSADLSAADLTKRMVERLRNTV